MRDFQDERKKLKVEADLDSRLEILKILSLSAFERVAAENRANENEGGVCLRRE